MSQDEISCDMKKRGRPSRVMPRERIVLFVRFHSYSVRFFRLSAFQKIRNHNLIATDRPMVHIRSRSRARYRVHARLRCLRRSRMRRICRGMVDGIERGLHPVGSSAVDPGRDDRNADLIRRIAVHRTENNSHCLRLLPSDRKPPRTSPGFRYRRTG